MAFSTQSGCQDQGQLMGPCAPKASQPFLDALGQPQPQGLTVMVTCMGGENLALGVSCGGDVLMVKSDTSDHNQQWIKEHVKDWNGRPAKDANGRPVFRLFNMATRQPLIYDEKRQVITLKPNKSNDASLMWSLSEDILDGFKAIRVADDMLILEVNMKDGKIKERDKLTLFILSSKPLSKQLNKQGNQLWKTDPIKG